MNKIALLLASVLALPACVHVGEDHHDGHSVGTLINVRSEGILWSRPAVTLLHTGEIKGDDFALDPDASGLIERANDYADHSARVKVTYVERYVCFMWNYSSCNIITDIQPDPTEVEHHVP